MLIHDMRSPTNSVQYGLFSVSAGIDKLKKLMEDHTPFAKEMEALDLALINDTYIEGTLENIAALARADH
jgi:hypothetical protein